MDGKQVVGGRGAAIAAGITVQGGGRVRVDEPREPPRPFGLPACAVLFADFEDGTYGGWKAAGDAFGKAPPCGALPYRNRVSGYSGRGLVNTFLNRDKSKGTLTSPDFTI